MGTVKSVLGKILILIIIILAITTIGVNAAVGPNEASDSKAFIIIKNGNELHSLFISDNYKMSGLTEGYEGAVYDKKTNTLTLNNVSADVLMTNQMGDDLKIELKGENLFHNVLIYGMGYGGCVEFKGTGRLEITAAPSMPGNLILNPEGCKATVTLSEKASVNIVSDSSAIVVMRSTNPADTLFVNSSVPAGFTSQVSNEIATKSMLKGNKQKAFSIYEKGGEYVYVLFRALVKSDELGKTHINYYADVYVLGEGQTPVLKETHNTTKAYVIEGYNKVAATYYNHTYPEKSVLLTAAD